MNSDLKAAIWIGLPLIAVWILFLYTIYVSAETYSFTNVTIWECTSPTNESCYVTGQSFAEREIVTNDTLTDIIQQQQRKFIVEVPSPYTA